jgi:hypothetical protein
LRATPQSRRNFDAHAKQSKHHPMENEAKKNPMKPQGGEEGIKGEFIV